MPKPITVWMVHLERGADLREIKGTLTLGDEALVFEDRARGSTTSFPFGTVRRAKRTLGSPVLLVRWERDGALRETAFYFTQPPPLPGTQAEVATDPMRTRGPSLIGSARQTSRRRQRKQAISYMTARAGVTRGAIKAWVEAISERTSPRG